MIRRAKPESHQVTDACYPVHCYSCDVDEPATGAYIVCGECGHVYRTAGALRRAYRRAVWQMIRNPQNRITLFGDEWRPGVIALQLWSLTTVRASKTYFCQHCIHDF